MSDSNRKIKAQDMFHSYVSYIIKSEIETIEEIRVVIKNYGLADIWWSVCNDVISPRLVRQTNYLYGRQKHSISLKFTALTFRKVIYFLMYMQNFSHKFLKKFQLLEMRNRLFNLSISNDCCKQGPIYLDRGPWALAIMGPLMINLKNIF